MRTFVIGNPLIIKRDHQALTYLQKSKQLSSRLTRWMLLLHKYNFKIQYCRSKENVVADTLSRQINSKTHIQSTNTDTPGFRTLQTIQNISEDMTNKFKKLDSLQFEDENSVQLRFELLKAARSDVINMKYRIINNLVTKNCKNMWKIMVPQVIIKQLV